MNNTTVEWCPHCDQEVILSNIYKVQICPECGKELLPCSICEQLYTKKGCSLCPLEDQKIIKKKNN